MNIVALSKVLISLLLTILVSATSIPAAVHAAEVPGLNKQVSLQAVDQSVPMFIESLFSQVGLPVKVSPNIPGTVNGSFSGTAESIFAKISQAFNVYLYYDTSVAYVYRSDDISSSILPLSHAAATRVSNSAKSMGFTDSRNTVNALPGGGLMVSGSARFVKQIDELSKASRAQYKSIKPKQSPIQLKLFRLKYAWADDVQLNVGGRPVTIPGVATMLRSLISEDGYLPAVSDAVIPNVNKLPKLKGQGLQASLNTQPQAKVANNPSRAASESSDFTIVAQPQLNAVAIRDRADRMPLYEELINSLDVEPKMVEIEATIIDINVDRQRELGFNWRAEGSKGGLVIGDSTDTATNPLTGGLASPNSSGGGVLSLVLGDSTQFFSRVRALEQEGAARIVSKPHVLTLSNVEAILGATTEFFVRVEGKDEVDLFNVPVGTTLRVTPHVFGEGKNSGIKLLVNIEDGSASSGNKVDNIPVVERSTISTQALIQQGSSLLIGGLVRESETEDEVRVPVLGKVPLVGKLFTSQRRTKTKTERLFMITPRITNSYQKHLNLQGPVLQGDPLAILAGADRITKTETAALQVRAQRLKADLQQEPPQAEPVNQEPQAPAMIDDMVAYVETPKEPTIDALDQTEPWQEVKVTQTAKKTDDEKPLSFNEALKAVQSEIVGSSGTAVTFEETIVK